MTSPIPTHPHSTAPLSVPSGAWELQPGRALTLRPRAGGVLRVAHGRLWVTLDGPHHGPPDNHGDRIVSAGAELVVDAGKRLVMEPWNTDGAATRFGWDPLPVALKVPVPPLPQQAGQRLAHVTVPLADLRLALTFGAGAAARLVTGVARLALELAAIIPAWRVPNLHNTRSGATRSWT